MKYKYESSCKAAFSIASLKENYNFNQEVTDLAFQQKK